MSLDTIGDVPPLDYVKEDDSPTDYTPSTMTQAVIGASIMLTIALAFVGAAQILQGALNGLH